MIISCCLGLGCLQGHDSSDAALNKGDKLVYLESHWATKDDFGQQADIVILNLNNGKRMYVTDDIFRDRMPSLSPDGTKVAFISERHVGEKIALVVGITGDERAYIADLRTGIVNAFAATQDSAWRMRYQKIVAVDWDSRNGRVLHATRTELYESTVTGDSTRLLFATTGSNDRISDLRADVLGRYVALKIDESPAGLRSRLIVCNLLDTSSRIIATATTQIQLANWTHDGSFYYAVYPDFYRYSPAEAKIVALAIPDSISRNYYGIGFSDTGDFFAKVDANAINSASDIVDAPRKLVQYNLKTGVLKWSMDGPIGCRELRWYPEWGKQ
jgi:hypothetical protein